MDSQGLGHPLYLWEEWSRPGHSTQSCHPFCSHIGHPCVEIHDLLIHPCVEIHVLLIHPCAQIHVTSMSWYDRLVIALAIPSLPIMGTLQTRLGIRLASTTAMRRSSIPCTSSLVTLSATFTLRLFSCWLLLFASIKSAESPSWIIEGGSKHCATGGQSWTIYDDHGRWRFSWNVEYAAICNVIPHRLFKTGIQWMQI